MVKTTAPYQILGYKILELVVKSKPIFSSDNDDLCLTSISRSSNPVLAKKKPTPELRSSHQPVFRYRILMRMRKK
jgi:hypothetical protein